MTETIPSRDDRGAASAIEADPLLICAPMRIEARAIRQGLRGQR